MNNKAIVIKFWGVRANTPIVDLKTLKFGGNTSCIEIRCGNNLIIFDAGTGLRLLGDNIRKLPVEGHIFFSNIRFELISGLPFFAPGYVDANNFTLWSKKSDTLSESKEQFLNIFKPPYFPVPLSEMLGIKSFNNFNENINFFPIRGIKMRGERIDLSNIYISYKIFFAQKSLTYITVMEDNLSLLKASLNKFLNNSDVTIVNFVPGKKNNISNRQELLIKNTKLLINLGTKSLIIHSHHHLSIDEDLERDQKIVTKLDRNVTMAHEGLKLII